MYYLKLKTKYLYYLIFWLFQPYIFIIFFKYGHDTLAYLQMAKGIGDNYLEPFWKYLFILLGNNFILKINIMIFMIIFLAFLILKCVSSYLLSFFRGFFVVLLLYSWEVSFVSGSLRQGIAVLAFTLFLLTHNKLSYILSIITHWSGAVYLLFNKYIFLILLIIIPFGIFFLINLDWQNINIFSRIIFYLQNPFAVNIKIILFIILNKLIIFILFLNNKKVLKNYFYSRIIIYFFILVPIIQVSIFLFTGSMQIFQRAGMIFSPFVIVFYILIIIYGDFKNRFIVYILILLKLLTRLLIVLN
jgi:hypothetical protein